MPLRGEDAMSNEAENTGQKDDKVSTHKGASAPTASEVEIQRRDNELRSERLDDREASLKRWFWVVGICVTINVAAFGYIVFETQNRGKTDQLVGGVDAQIAADYPEKTDQAVESVRENPEASLITKAIASAISLQRLGKRDEAIEKWRAVAHVAEDNDNDQAARAWLSVGYLLEKKAPEDSLSAYGRAIRLKPDFAEAYHVRGVAKDTLGRHEDALADFDRAIRLKPDFATAYSSRGIAKDLLGRHEDSLADFDRAIRLKPDLATAYNSRGITKGALGRHEDALADFDQAIRLKPDFAIAYNSRGVAKDTLGRHEDALADFDQAIRLKPDYAKAYYNRGIAKGQLGGNDKARAEFETALALARTAGNTNLEAQVEQSLRALNVSPLSSTAR